MVFVYFDDTPPVPAVIGQSIFQHAERTPEALNNIASSCERLGNCHECIVSVISGDEMLSPPDEKESFLATGPQSHDVCFRLACQAKVISDRADIHVRTFQSHMKILEDGTLNRSDMALSTPLAPRVRRQGDDVLMDGLRIDRYRDGIYGLAIDAGTTTVVVHLVNLESGHLSSISSFENPQKYSGNSVIHRIAYESRRPGMLQKSIIGLVNWAIKNLSVLPEQIYEASISGNPTMQNLFFKLDVRPLGQRPFKSIAEIEYRAGKRNSTELYARPADLGLSMNPEGSIYGLPVIACHVGADTSAGLLAVGMEATTKPVLFLDIGTNSEIALGCGDRILAASCAAGPAFEGGGVRYGMPAFTGAIEHVEFTRDRIVCQVIGNGKPLGICGSGLVDALAEMRRHGLMDKDGKLKDGSSEMPLVQDGSITLSRADISHLAQAKSAILAGQKILLKQYGLRLDEIDRFYLAGAFAHAIDIEKAKEIGLLLPLSSEKFVKAGNTSVLGTRMALLSVSRREDIVNLAGRVEHVELEREPNFYDLFVEGLRWRDSGT